MHTHAKRNRCFHGKNRQKERTIVSNQPHSFQAPLLNYQMEYYGPKVFSSRLSSRIFLHRRSEQRQEAMIPITFCSDLQALLLSQMKDVLKPAWVWGVCCSSTVFITFSLGIIKRRIPDNSKEANI